VALRIAVKRLSAVETNPKRSNQHEFHAGELRRELELPATRVTGPFNVLIVGDAGEPPVVDTSTYTLYDARERNPARSAEWRLYYASDVIAQAAEEGDLLVLYRHSEELRAVIAPADSPAERELLRALELGDDAVRERFLYLDVPVPDEREGREVAGQLTLADAQVTSAYPATEHALFRRATRERGVPATGEMARAAAEIVGRRAIGIDDPDAYLYAVLAAETELYFAIEENIQQARYDALAATGPNLTEILDFAMSVQQSRRSRRGQSLQNHFATLLRAWGISYTAQCETESGERPDFLVPSCTRYHDEEFPTEGLRMVACKSTAKERWRQVLNEAARIPEKYLLTIDTQLTLPVIRAMTTARLQPFLPQPVIENAYASHPGKAELASVASLLDRLVAAARLGDRYA
jgi:hypothetical protein